MRISDAFPSKYLAAVDVEKEPTVQIYAVGIEKMQDGTPKPVVYFNGSPKGLVLNKTNGNAIAQLYGDDTDNWAGKHITLFPVWTEFQGQQVRAVRVRPPDSGPRVNDPAQQGPNTTPPAQTTAQQIGDALPDHMQAQPGDPGPGQPTGRSMNDLPDPFA